eukprot:TRINITY_DN5231_c0_g1_i1.p1 TRINITY_DN5231_c0_g1~~TRINITY_DN5231_c0_g1_i1.p1  ORF type:complete len:280 (-),score=87.11 TRINITY_DN5231_c0_g1_i1:87-866(-)
MKGKDDNGSFARFLFLRKHSSKSESEATPARRTLFVANLPPYCTEGFFRSVFGGCGEIERVTIIAGHPPDNFPFAYVVFSTSEALAKALLLEPKDVEGKADCELGQMGVALWESQNRIMFAGGQQREVELQRDADKYVAEFARRRQGEMKAGQRAASKPDADGFTMVTYSDKRKSKTVGEVGAEDGDARVPSKKRLNRASQEAVQRRAHRKGRQSVMLNFYRFQQRQQKKQQLDVLRQKFEADKERITKLKQKRAFRPY